MRDCDKLHFLRNQDKLHVKVFYKKKTFPKRTKRIAKLTLSRAYNVKNETKFIGKCGSGMDYYEIDFFEFAARQWQTLFAQIIKRSVDGTRNVCKELSNRLTHDWFLLQQQQKNDLIRVFA